MRRFFNVGVGEEILPTSRYYDKDLYNVLKTTGLPIKVYAFFNAPITPSNIPDFVIDSFAYEDEKEFNKYLDNLMICMYISTLDEEIEKPDIEIFGPSGKASDINNALSHNIVKKLAEPHQLVRTVDLMGETGLELKLGKVFKNQGDLLFVYSSIYEAMYIATSDKEKKRLGIKEDIIDKDEFRTHVKNLIYEDYINLKPLKDIDEWIF